MQMRLRRWNQEGFLPTELSEYGYGAVDLLCINGSGGTLYGGENGSDWVDFDWANLTRGNIPVIKKAPVSTKAIGCMHYQEGTVADTKSCWVRIFGWHPSALVLGHASLAAAYPLVIDSATAGLATYTASPYGRELGRIIAAYTTAANAAKAVFITNPGCIPT